MVKNKQAYIILGLGYGDEGKGLATDYLCTHSHNPLVIRFNGGHQAGHTVVTKKGERHTFSSFGAGTLRGVPTYWSEFCTFSPVYFLEEYNSLSCSPIVFINTLCPVTTHYDVLFNRAMELTRGKKRHGSCGVGFGATLYRHFNDDLKLEVRDLFSPINAKNKLAAIRDYYQIKFDSETLYMFKDFNHDNEDKVFLETLSQLEHLQGVNQIETANEHEFFNKWDTYIFEGAQGIMLDVTFGKAPHVTKSNTTSKNALKILYRNIDSTNVDVDVIYVSRAYQTRHGAGPFNENNSKLSLTNVEAEANTFNEYQGEFRTSILDLQELNYALGCDAKFSHGLTKNLFITCLDQINSNKIPIINNGIELLVSVSEIPSMLECNFKSVKFSYSNCSEDLL